MYQKIPINPASGFGRTFLIGGTVVLAGLGGFYYSMLKSKHRQEKSGTNPYHEQIIAHISKEPEVLKDMIHTSRGLPVPLPIKEHDAKHQTIHTAKASADYNERVRYQVPPPQRGHTHDPSKAYTKSPDYVNNYEKTTRNHKVTP